MSKAAPAPQRMSKKRQDVVYGPRMLVMFHDGETRVVNRHFHALAWMEKHGSDPQVQAVHIMWNDNGRVIHERRPATEVQFLGAAGSRSTAKEFEAYLCRKLMENGGSPSAYEHLRVEKPVVEAVVSADKKADIDELYSRAARVLSVPEEELRKKYGHLNPGLQAMNLRNRLRAKGRAV